MKLWENSFGYALGRWFVDGCTLSCFRRITVTGRENIPTDGAVIFASNHCNTLMDALVLLRENKGPIAFGARADMFRSKFAGALRWLKIVPLARSRDGAESVLHNYEIFNEVADTLDHGAPFCLYPEGTHRAKRSLQRLKKGVFRIAAIATRKISKTVYVVPVGIDYGDYYEYGHDLKISYGEPINMTRYMAEHPDISESDGFRDLVELLYQRISSLITFFPDDEHYEEAVARHYGRKPFGFADYLWRIPFGLVAFPVFVLAALLNLVIWLPSEIVISRLGDKAWSNSVRYCFKLVLYPILFIVLAVFAFMKMPWYLALVFLAFFVMSHTLFYRFLNFYNRIIRGK